jgi:hypothetical protein
MRRLERTLRQREPALQHVERAMNKRERASR